jgi:hypothetical protein
VLTSLEFLPKGLHCWWMFVSKRLYSKLELNTCTDTHKYKHTHTNTNTHTHTHTHTYIHIYTHTLHTHIHPHAHTVANTNTHTHPSTHIHTHIARDTHQLLWKQTLELAFVHGRLVLPVRVLMPKKYVLLSCVLFSKQKPRSTRFNRKRKNTNNILLL